MAAFCAYILGAAGFLQRDLCWRPLPGKCIGFGPYRDFSRLSCLPALLLHQGFGFGCLIYNDPEDQPYSLLREYIAAIERYREHKNEYPNRYLAFYFPFQ